MKYCLYSRQKPELLKEADEIWIQFRDIDSIIDIGHEYTNANIILEIPTNISDQELTTIINKYSQLVQTKLILALSNIHQVEYCYFMRYKDYFYNQEINTYDELTSLKHLNVSYIRLGINLFFDYDEVVKQKIPVRLNPTHFTKEVLGREIPTSVDTWIRPEDLHLYEDSTIEFFTSDLTAQAAYYKIYKYQKAWPGNLKSLFNIEFNDGVNPLNRIIDPDFGARRTSCRHICAKNGSCHHCYSFLQFASMVKELKEYKDILNTEGE